MKRTEMGYTHYTAVVLPAGTNISVTVTSCHFPFFFKQRAAFGQWLFPVSPSFSQMLSSIFPLFRFDFKARC